MKRLTLASLLLSSMLLAGMGNNMPAFGDFDTDGNGEVTQAEFENTQQERIQTKEEAGRMTRNATNAAAFKDIDVNNDGVINAVEFTNH